jgi:Flp pilus assembly protein TadG
MTHDPEKLLIRSRKRVRGVATVEFALTAILLFTVLFVIMDFSYLFWGNLSMQHAVREGARYAVTGQSNLDPNPQGTAQDRCDAAIVEIRNQSMGFFDRVSSTVVFKTLDATTGAITPVPGNSCAAAGQIIIISVNCSLAPLTPFIKPFLASGKWEFVVSTTMKNEAFSGA